MSKVNFFALGGLDENDNKCFVLSIDDNIFIFNSGISVPVSSKLGIEKTIPDFSWLISKKQNIRGIIIGEPTYENYGSLPFLLSTIGEDKPIFTSDVGSFLIKSWIEEEKITCNPNFKIISNESPVIINNIKINPFQTTTSMPYSQGFILNNGSETIVYLDNFVISSIKKSCFSNEITKLNKMVNLKPMLIVGTGLIGKSLGFTIPNHSIVNFIRNIFSDVKSRLVFALYEDDLFKITVLLKFIASQGRPVFINNERVVKIIKYLISSRLLNIKDLYLIEENDVQKYKNIVILFISHNFNLYEKLMNTIEDDEQTLLKQDDTFILLCEVINGYEHIEATLVDSLYKFGTSKVYRFDKTICRLQASNEDHKLLVHILEPQTIIPTSGLYMDMISYRKVVSTVIYNDTDIVLLSKGQIAQFNNGKYLKSDKSQFIELRPQLIDSHGTLDVGDSSLFERVQMRENGVVLVNILIDKDSHKIIKTNYETVGVININNENKQLQNEINKSLDEDITKAINAMLEKDNDVDIKELKNLIKKSVSKKYEKKFDKKPSVLSTIIYNSTSNI